MKDDMDDILNLTDRLLQTVSEGVQQLISGDRPIPEPMRRVLIGSLRRIDTRSGDLIRLLSADDMPMEGNIGVPDI